MFPINEIEVERLYKLYLSSVECLEGQKYELNAEVVLSREEFECRLSTVDFSSRLELFEVFEGGKQNDEYSVDQWLQEFDTAKNLFCDSPAKQSLDGEG